MTTSVRSRRRLTGRYGPLSFISDRQYNPFSWQSDRLMRDRVAFSRSLYRWDLKSHYGCVNAIEFSHGGGKFMVSGGDDRRVLLWNMEKALSDIGSPFVMKGEHNSNIFCLAFDNENKKVFSGGNDEQVSVHDVATGETLDVFLHEDAVYGLSVDPNNSHAFASACDDGRILIYDIREPPSTDPFCLANYMSSMHAVMYNPVEPRLLATANAKEGIGLWDIRKPRSCLLRYGSGLVQQSCMSVRINSAGDRLLALRRRLPPVLYNIHNNQPICEFDHSGYYNSCTMKSCTFAGDRDQYVISGSDDFNLYMWKIPDDLTERQYISDAHMVLKGHRSIVNQVRFNPANHLIISSGVEKIIKVWSPFPLKDEFKSQNRHYERRTSDRPIFTHEEYINLVLRSGHVMTHDYSHQSTNEDPRMLAFFDSLVQRELEGCSSDDNFTSEEEELLERIVQFSRSDLSDDSSEESDTANANNTTEASNNNENTTDNSAVFSPFTIAFASVMAAQAAEENENTRPAHPCTNTEQSTSETAENSVSANVTENDQNQNERMSISELISQKRKEIKRHVIDNKRLKKKRKRTSTISSSDSSDDENENDLKLERTVNEKPCSSKYSESSPLDKGHSDNKISAQKQKVQIKLKKLKQLRNNVLNSDSENSDLDKKTKPKTLGNPFKGSSFGAESFKNEETTSSKCLDNQEIGPYLHETDNSQFSFNFGNKHTNTSEFHSDSCKSNWHSNSTANSHTVKSTNMLNHSVELDKEKCKEVTCNNVDLDKTPNGKVSIDGHFEKLIPIESSDKKNSASDNHFKKTVDMENDPVPSTSFENSNEHVDRHSDNSDSQPSWMEFKRFKRHVERAKRHYRHRSTSDED